MIGNILNKTRPDTLISDISLSQLCHRIPKWFCKESLVGQRAYMSWGSEKAHADPVSQLKIF